MAAAIVRLRAAAAVGSRRHFASSSPCLMLPPNKMYCLREKKVVNINNNVEKELESDSVVGSSHGWVGLLKGKKGSLSVWNPMSGSRIKLPPMPDIWKLVVDDGECRRAMVMPAPCSKRLGVYCPDECSEWTMFGSIRDCYADLVSCSRRNRAYSLTSCFGQVVRWDISEPRRPRMEWKESLYELGYRDHHDLVEKEKENIKMFPPVYPCAYLEAYNKAYPYFVYAEHSDQLFVVTRHYLKHEYHDDSMFWKRWDDDRLESKRTVAFDVHLLVENENENENSRQLRHMKHSIDGLVMFVGLYNSFAVAAADFPHLKPDSIYFTDHVDWRDGLYDGFDVGIYDYKNRTISSCYYYPNYRQLLNSSCYYPYNRQLLNSSGYYPIYHQLLNKPRRYPFWFTPNPKGRDN